MSYKSIYSLIGLKEEVNRLERQAKIGWAKEFRTLQWLGLKDGMKILDVGAGPGFYTELLLENLPNSKITALEIDKNLMEVAKSRLAKYTSKRLNFVESSIIGSALESGKYDFVISRFVFQHLEEPIAAAKEIYRVLKPGGIVAVIDSDRGLWGLSEPDYLMNSEKNILTKLEKSARWNRECGRNLLKILKSAGFTKLDFEAVTVHSDIVGVKNIIGDFGLKNDDIVALGRKNPRLARMLKMTQEMTASEKTTVIILNLIAKGVKT